MPKDKKMIEEKLRKLGIIIPEPPAPLAAYVPGVKIGNMIYTSGQLPTENGELKFSGVIDTDISEENGIKAARLSVLNCLGVVKSLCGSLDNVERIVKLTVFVCSDETFYNHPKIANGASELLLEIFGEAGKHARSAVGVSALPKGATVEIEMIAQIKV